MTTLTSRLGIHPIIQAPMAGVDTPALAAAVSNAGGLGSLGIGANTLAQARLRIQQTKALTQRPFNVNVFCHRPPLHDARRDARWLGYLAPLFDELGLTPPATLQEIYRSFVDWDEALQLLVEERPAVVSFHFGLPSQRQITALQSAGICTLACATNLHEARLIEHAGIDAIVAQGIEAGGHRGMFDPDVHDEQLSTAALLRLLAAHCRVPLIAAGGLMNGQGIAAALDLGAAAAQLGTAFLLCPESGTHIGHRQALQSKRAAMTRLTAVLSGRPARGLPNRLIEFGEAPGSPPPAAYPLAYDAAKQLNAAALKQGNHEFGAYWAGQGAQQARELPAAALVAALMQELATARQKPYRAFHQHD